jgi:fructosamine-3-kinase/nicotinic acid mononucleotide adenylyltransferase
MVSINPIDILNKLNITDYEQITIGKINHVYIFDNKTKVIKINQNNENLKSEYNSLKILEMHNIPIPKIYEIHDNYMIFEYIQNDTIEDNKKYDLLTNASSSLHSIKNDKFGMDFDTFSGYHKVSNQYCDTWDSFFKNNRWKPLIDMILESDINFKTDHCTAMKIYDLIPVIFKDVFIVPSMLHGDINPNNYLIKDDKIIFIDPAVFYGDPLYDLACHNYWIQKIEEIPIYMLYYASILLSVYNMTRSEGRLKPARKYMQKILNLYPPLYKSLLFPYNVNKNESYKNIIIQGGSYNPIHHNHVNNLLIARNYIDHNALIVFSLASDERIISKCSNGIPMYHREKMLKLAIHDQQNVIVDCTLLWEDILITHYQNMYPCANIYICCGTDAIKYNYEHFSKGVKFLVIKRNKHKSKLIDDNIIYYDNMDQKTMSSSEIRKNKTNENLYPQVYEYMTQNNLFKNT